MYFGHLDIVRDILRILQWLTACTCTMYVVLGYTRYVSMLTSCTDVCMDKKGCLLKHPTKVRGEGGYKHM